MPNHIFGVWLFAGRFEEANLLLRFSLVTHLAVNQGKLVVERSSNNSGLAARSSAAKFPSLWENKSPQFEAKLGKVSGSGDETADQG